MGRRIMIIIVEDSILHPQLPILSWLLLAASNGFLPPSSVILFCLKITHQIASCRVRDPAWVGFHQAHRVFPVHAEIVVQLRGQGTPPLPVHDEEAAECRILGCRRIRGSGSSLGYCLFDLPVLQLSNLAQSPPRVSSGWPTEARLHWSPARFSPRGSSCTALPHDVFPNRRWRSLSLSVWASSRWCT